MKLQIPTKIAAAADKKNISKHDRVEVFSTGIHRKKMFINNLQAILLQSERVSEMHFPVIWRPEFQKFFLCCLTCGYRMETVN